MPRKHAFRPPFEMLDRCLSIEGDGISQASQRSFEELLSELPSCTLRVIARRQRIQGPHTKHADKGSCRNLNQGIKRSQRIAKLEEMRVQTFLKLLNQRSFRGVWHRLIGLPGELEGGLLGLEEKTLTMEDPWKAVSLRNIRAGKSEIRINLFQLGTGIQDYSQ